MFGFGGHCHLEVDTMSLSISPFVGCVDTEDVRLDYRVP